MKKKKQNQRFYEVIISFLRKPIFRLFANIFSHGGTHFIALIIVLVAAIYYGFFKDQDNISPQNIGIHIGWSSVESPSVQKIYENYKPQDSIDNVKIHIMLNSQLLATMTEGKYQNGILVEFDGKAKNYAFTDPVSHKIISKYQDSVIISIYSEPKIDSFETITDYDLFPANSKTIHIKNDSLYKDSIWFEQNIKHITTYVYPIPTDTIAFNKKYTKEGFADISLIPVDYHRSLGEMTKNKLYFCSNDIGHADDNPYYYYYFNIPPADNTEVKSIDFQISDPIIKERFKMKYTQCKNLQYNFIFPEPDAIRNGMIEYNSKEKKEAIIKNQGVIIQAVDIDALNKQNRNAFLYSVLIGTGLAFALDIIIQLIRELKRLHKRKKQL